MAGSEQVYDVGVADPSARLALLAAAPQKASPSAINCSQRVCNAGVVDPRARAEVKQKQ